VATISLTDRSPFRRLRHRRRQELELELQRAAERERDLLAQVDDADRVKEAFIQAVSHELRTPLTSLRGFTTTLQRNGDRLTDEQRDLMVDRIAANAEKLLRLLGDVLDVDRLSRGILVARRQRTDVAELVLRVLTEIDFGARRLRTEVAPVVAHLDGPKVERIVENLAANVCKHTPDGTTITVTVDADPVGVNLAVTQDGVPVPEHLKREIFRPFRQGTLQNPHTPGVGIGLTLVARFAELHGGRAWVEDRPDGGAVFRVRLPHAAQPGAGTDVPANAPRARTGSTVRS
jgi:signal transduction histidine kinase